MTSHFKTALLLNIGNTNTEAAVLKKDVLLSPCSTFPTKVLGQSPENFPKILTENLSIPWIVSSVVPSVEKSLRSAKHPDTLLFISPESARDIDFSGVDTTTLGADRVANSAAAVELDLTPVIILDCGTAITVEIIDSDKRFSGGAILPGRKMMRRSLADSTDQLPYINTYPASPPSPGKNTEESIVFGIDAGLIGAITYLLQTTANNYPQESAFTKVVTGGDRNYFADNIAELEKAPSDFTMQGLAHIARRLPSRIFIPPER